MRESMFFIICLYLLAAFPLLAQDANTLPTPQRIEVTAPDGLTLVGDYYPVPDAPGEMPTVILLHGSSGYRQLMDNAVQPMLDKGFNVLNVDQRAHGETKGDRDLVIMSDDVLIWMDWLRQQPSVADDSISTIGVSMGAVTALAGCALDATCLTAIAISPGDFPTLDEAMFDRLADRSVLFIVGRQDNVLYDTNKLVARTSGETALYIFNTGVHGSSYFSTQSDYRDTVIDLLVNWLNDHLGRLHGEE